MQEQLLQAAQLAQAGLELEAGQAQQPCQALQQSWLLLSLWRPCQTSCAASAPQHMLYDFLQSRVMHRVRAACVSTAHVCSCYLTHAVPDRCRSTIVQLSLKPSEYTGILTLYKQAKGRTKGARLRTTGVSLASSACASMSSCKDNKG